MMKPQNILNKIKSRAIGITIGSLIVLMLLIFSLSIAIISDIEIAETIVRTIIILSTYIIQITNIEDSLISRAIITLSPLVWIAMGACLGGLFIKKKSTNPSDLLPIFLSIGLSSMIYTVIMGSVALSYHSSFYNWSFIFIVILAHIISFSTMLYATSRYSRKKRILIFIGIASIDTIFLAPQLYEDTLHTIFLMLQVYEDKYILTIGSLLVHITIIGIGFIAANTVLIFNDYIKSRLSRLLVQSKKTIERRDK